MPPENWQMWGINHLTRKPVPGSDHPLLKNLFLTSSLNLPWYCFVLFPDVLSLMRARKERETKREMKFVLVPHVPTGLNCWILTTSSK